jgi:hypothetical protein
MTIFPDWPEHAAQLAPDSVNLCVSSIPFADLFTYSGKNEDLGNSKAGVDLRDTEFGLGTRFFVEQLVRVMEPGGIACIHIQQLTATNVQHGFMGRRDFRGAVVDLFCAGGFDWTGETAIPKNPQAIAQRQKLHSLMFVTGKRDSRRWAPAVNDFVLMFRKPGEGVPVRALFDAQVNPDGWVTTDEWIRNAHGVWSDIRETDVLTGWQMARESDSEKHVCPLQLEVIRRCVRLYSNPGSLVLDPFMGVGSTAVVALEQGRNAVGFELKESYHALCVRNCEAKLRELRQQQRDLPLFASLELEAV